MTLQLELENSHWSALSTGMMTNIHSFPVLETDRKSESWGGFGKTLGSDESDNELLFDCVLGARQFTNCFTHTFLIQS